MKSKITIIGMQFLIQITIGDPTYAAVNRLHFYYFFSAFLLPLKGSKKAEGQQNFGNSSTISEEHERQESKVADVVSRKRHAFCRIRRLKSSCDATFFQTELGIF